MPYCSQCGKEVSSNARYCYSCGARIESSISGKDLTGSATEQIAKVSVTADRKDDPPTPLEPKPQTNSHAQNYSEFKDLVRTDGVKSAAANTSSTSSKLSVAKATLASDVKTKRLLVLNLILGLLMFLPWLTLDLGLYKESWSLISFSMDASDLSSSASSLLGSSYTSTDFSSFLSMCLIVSGALWLLAIIGVVVSITNIVKNTDSWYAFGSGMVVIAAVISIIFCLACNYSVSGYSLGFACTIWVYVALILGIVTFGYSYMRGDHY